MTQHPPHTAPPPAIPLATELRGILDDLHDAEHGDVPRHQVRGRLLRLAEHVEQVAAESPAEHVLEPAHAGLDPAQESRAGSLAAAAALLAPTLDVLSLAGFEANLDEIVRAWVGLAYHGDAWISDGHVPS